VNMNYGQLDPSEFARHLVTSDLPIQPGGGSTDWKLRLLKACAPTG
jgi:hypothetical protein